MGTYYQSNSAHPCFIRFSQSVGPLFHQEHVASRTVFAGCEFLIFLVPRWPRWSFMLAINIKTQAKSSKYFSFPPIFPLSELTTLMYTSELKRDVAFRPARSSFRSPYTSSFFCLLQRADSENFPPPMQPLLSLSSSFHACPAKLTFQFEQS